MGRRWGCCTWGPGEVLGCGGGGAKCYSSQPLEKRNLWAGTETPRNPGIFKGGSWPAGPGSRGARARKSGAEGSRARSSGHRGLRPQRVAGARLR